MRRAVFLLVLSAMLAVAAPSGKIFPFAYEQQDFPNGLRLITVPTDYPNVVALFVVVQVGSRNEVEPGKTGFAHFFEHMMFRGTKQFSSEKYSALLKRAGAASNAFTSEDFTAFHTTFSKEDLEPILALEADRFQNLEYSEAAFKTEALAVLGEYNKNSTVPFIKLFEVTRNTAFDRHSYKHEAMGILPDIQDMPNQLVYGRTFFDRFYRPEYTTLLVVGDVQREKVRSMVGKYWGEWKRGTYKTEVPNEPEQKSPRAGHVDWPSPTLPLLAVVFRAPAYSDTGKDYAALNLLSALAFSDSSDLYQKLVIQQQKVDILSGDISAHVDPFEFEILARVKNATDVDTVRDDIYATLAAFKQDLVPADKLDRVKKRMRYSFALGLDNSEAIARTLASYIAVRRTPETINRLFSVYEQLTPEDLRSAARKYFVDSGRTVVTLSEGKSK